MQAHTACIEFSANQLPCMHWCIPRVLTKSVWQAVEEELERLLQGEVCAYDTPACNVTQRYEHLVPCTYNPKWSSNSLELIPSPSVWQSLENHSVGALPSVHGSTDDELNLDDDSTGTRGGSTAGGTATLHRAASFPGDMRSSESSAPRSVRRQSYLLDNELMSPGAGERRSPKAPGQASKGPDHTEFQSPIVTHGVWGSQRRLGGGAISGHFGARQGASSPGNARHVCIMMQHAQLE